MKRLVVDLLLRVLAAPILAVTYLVSVRSIRKERQKKGLE